MIKIFNDNTEDYVEELRGKTYTVPAKGSILLNNDDGMRLFGSMSRMGKDGKPIKKMLRKEVLKDEPTKKFVSDLTGEEFPTQEALDKHLAANADKALKTDKKEPTKKQPVIKGVVCPGCGKVCKDIKGLWTHLAHCKGDLTNGDTSADTQ